MSTLNMVWRGLQGLTKGHLEEERAEVNHGPVFGDLLDEFLGVGVDHLQVCDLGTRECRPY